MSELAQETDVSISVDSSSLSDDVSQPFLEEADGPELMTRSQAWNLYTSHCFSTWNMRMYEFAAIIFTATAFPDTLLATSVRGIVRTLASVCFSSLVGRWVDQTPNRLKTLTTTIVVNRISVVVSCTLWSLIFNMDNAQGLSLSLPSLPLGLSLKSIIFSIILVLGIVESLSASGNTLSMERDWIVVAASPPGKPYDLTQLNAVMRRIDLICKLVAPIFISIVISAVNTKTGVIVVGGMSACSFLLEILCARRVWNRNSRLREPKAQPHTNAVNGSAISLSIRTKFMGFILQYAQDFKQYFSSIVWVPSLALAILHISALAYSGTLITFLLNSGFTLGTITIARAAGSIVEISSTVVTPFGVKHLSKAKNHGRFPPRSDVAEEAALQLLDSDLDPNENGSQIGIFRLGLWGITWQLINLVPVILTIWSMFPSAAGNSPSTPKLLSSITLFFFLSTSRLGLWIYDLTTQQLTQTMTISSRRSSFAGVENSFVSLFELLQHVMVIILHKPEQFKWIAGISWLAVAVSTVLYSAWVWRIRGHLVHWDFLKKSCDCVNVRLGQR